MDYKAILNMYSVECAACFTPIAMAYHEYHYRTGHETCKQCTKKYKKVKIVFLKNPNKFKSVPKNVQKL